MKYGRKKPLREAYRVAYSFGAIATVLVLGGCVKSESPGADSTASDSTTAASAACPTDNGGITLPPGFCATVFADNIGHARHIVVNANGDVYVNTWSGEYYNTP